MAENLVLTVTGPDRIGMVEEVTGLLVARGGNVEISRMTRLGGEFAILMLAAVPTDQVVGLETDLGRLTERGYKVATTQARPSAADAHPEWPRFRIEVQGADHEGIIQEVARYLSHRGINIESMDSDTAPAPISGVPLFTMSAEVAVPPEAEARAWETGLHDLSGQLNLEIQVRAADSPGRTDSAGI